MESDTLTSGESLLSEENSVVDPDPVGPGTFARGRI
jgi:hypothetical protein